MDWPITHERYYFIIATVNIHRLYRHNYINMTLIHSQFNLCAICQVDLATIFPATIYLYSTLDALALDALTYSIDLFSVGIICPMIFCPGKVSGLIISCSKINTI